MIDIIHRNGPTGRVIHDRNFTWCKHRRSAKFDAKGKKMPEIETCAITRQTIPHPRMPGRYCDSFQQENCPCQECNIFIPIGSIY